MGADLNNIIKCQKLTDDHVQFITYQILRGLKVCGALKIIYSADPLDPKEIMWIIKEGTTEPYSIFASQYIHSADIIHRVSFFPHVFCLCLCKTSDYLMHAI